MTQFDPTAISDGPTETINSYEGPAPALVFEAYRNGVSVNVVNGTVGLGDPTLATAADTFEIGSQTKMLTTTVLLQLVEEGKFSLDDRLADAMDITPLSWMPNIHDVTLRQLMTHSSGIPDFFNDVPELYDAVIEMLSQDPPKPVGPEQYLELLEAIDPSALFAPGEAFNYSNTGFLLLGLLIENATGNTLAEEYQTRIFDPVGMTSSGLPGFDRPEGILRSYAVVEGEIIEVTNLPVADLGDGGVVSNTGDMIRFMKALFIDGTLVPENQMGALEQYFTAEDGPEGSPFIGHGGGTYGTGSITLFHPATGTIFSAAETMRYGFDRPSDEVFQALASLINTPAWGQNYGDGGDLEFTTTAADLELSETIGTDGTAQTLLTVDGVTLSIDTRLSELETDRLTFKDGSLLFVADETGSNFRVENDGSDTATAGNQLVGLSGKDRLVGGRGDDKISGGAGNDSLNGRNGDDSISGDAGNDKIAGKRGNDHLFGGRGEDKISGGRGDDRLDGDSGDDILRGGRGNDDLSGSSGDDILRGGRGNDTLNGGEGDDFLKGGHGSDIFVFNENSGNDTIKSFETGKDQIDLSALNLTFQDLQMSERSGGRGYDITFGEDTLVIASPNGELTETDFIF
ncbi:MAG: serine hydrolase [Pelagimonas sp.]|uniref:serine hydrolase n=1 Tax=Pelagimonas sp. TaxID=2073170 RepID=UPI003D6BBE4C